MTVTIRASLRHSSFRIPSADRRQLGHRSPDSILPGEWIDQGSEFVNNQIVLANAEHLHPNG